MRASLTTFFLLLFSLSAPRVTAAQADLNYQQATAQALSAYASADYARARVLFERAHALDPSARTFRALGLTAVNLKHYDEARHDLVAALSDSRQPLGNEQRAQVSDTLRWMDSTLSVLQVVATPPEAQMLIDGVSVSNEVTLDPGKHILRVEAAGYAPLERTFACQPAQHRTLELALQRVDLQPRAADMTSSPAPSLTSATAATDSSVWSRWWFWTAVGLVVIAGGTAAVIAATTHSDQQPEPPGRLVRTLTVSY